MKDSFIFTRETARAIVDRQREERYAAMYYAMHYGLGDVSASDKPEYAEITRCIDQANKDETKVSAEEVREIVGYLNAKRGKDFKPTTKKTRHSIGARFAEGYTVEDFKAVIDCMYDEWHGTDMERFLRPETLFGPKFESYINYAKTKDKNSSFDTDSFFEAALAKAYGGTAE